ncbi:MAG: DMT family transporter [Anaerolineales bacterium]
MESKSTQANLFLLLTAVIWGGGFVAQRLGMQVIGPFMFNGFRFLIGGLTLLPVIFLRRKRVDESPASTKQILLIGCAAGLLLFFGATFQQLGLVYTTAGKAGFITGLYVIIVPLLGIIWGDKAPISTWLGAVLAVIGLYLLSATKGLNIASGDGMVLIGAFFWAFHVQFIARFSPRIDPIQLSFVQSIFTSMISFAVGFAREPFVSSQVISAVMPILYGGVISIGIAYTLQIVAQRNAKPSHAAIILSLESVFAVFLGWLILGELLSPRIILGCLLMLSGMMVSQIHPRESDKVV